MQDTPVPLPWPHCLRNGVGRERDRGLCLKVAGERNATVSTYMTVGEVADLAGVTVRSIQYYDQQGILSPSAKGRQNQRLYTPADIERLQCILVLKYAGLSLAQIKEWLGGHRSLDCSSARDLFVEALHETENAFSSLLKRYATLQSLAEQVGQDASRPCPDWRVLASSIERLQEEGEYFWRLSCIYGEDGGASEDDAYAKDRMVAEWHGLIAEAINNMREEVPIESERSQALAERFLRLRAEDASLPSGQGFLLLENPPRAAVPDRASFDGMRQSVSAYLAHLAAHYARDHGADNVPPDASIPDTLTLACANGCPNAGP